MNNIVKARDKGAITASENLHILQGVLSVVTLSSFVGQVAGPDQNGVSSGAHLHIDILATVALDHEL